MEPFDFLVGLLLGFLLGGLGAYVMVRVKGWFTSSEVRGLRREVRSLEKRIEQKDRHIDEMLRRAEDVVREVKDGRSKGHGS